ncbi:MAG: hypothetical protein AAFX87_24025 [Bacteroidota bacterium]
MIKMDKVHYKLILLAISVMFFSSIQAQNSSLEKGDELFVEGDYEKAFKFYEKKIKKEIPEAYSKLGFMYDHGLGVQQSKKKAHEYYQRAIAKGNPLAAAALARHYQRGYQVKKDQQKQDSLWRLAGAQMDYLNASPQGRFLMALMHLQGIEGNENEKLAYKLIDELDGKGFAQARYIKGWMTLYGVGTTKNVTTAKRILVELANAGNESAQYHYGIIKYDGLDRKQDYAEASKYFELAAQQGQHDAMYYLGLMYINGNGVKLNIQTGLGWLEKGSKSENQFASYTLGELYHKGNHVRKDINTALSYYKESHRQYHKSAVNEIGEIYYLGAGSSFKKDIEKAIYWFEEGVKINNASTQYWLGRIYRLGEDVDQDKVKAEELLIQSANQGFKWGQYELANFYLSEKSYAKSKTYYAKAAEQGHPQSQHQLAKLMALTLKDNDKDLSGVIDLFISSAKQGYEPAQISLGELYSSGKILDEKRTDRLNYDSAYFWYNKALKQGSEKAAKVIDTYKSKNADENAKRFLLFSSFVHWQLKQGKHPDAYFQLSRFYRTKKPFKDVVFEHFNLKTGFEYLGKAADSGHPEALRILGLSYMIGNNLVKKDLKKGYDFLERAYKGGDPKAFDILYAAYIAVDFGGEPEYDKAYQLAISEYGKNKENAAYKLGDLFIYGRGIEDDLAKGLRFTVEASEYGSEGAAKLLGDFWDKQNKKATKQYYDFQKVIASANNGNADSQFEIARFYLDTVGVYSYKLGLKWMEESARSGHFMAQSSVANKYYKDKDFTRFSEFAELAIENDRRFSDTEELGFLYGRLALREFDKDPISDKTLNYLSDYIKYTPRPVGYYMRSLSFYQLKEFEASLKDILTVEKLDRSLVDDKLLLTKGFCLLKMGEKEKGCDVFKSMNSTSAYISNCLEKKTNSGRVSSSKSAVSTGVYINEGDMVKMSASGSVRYGTWAGSGGPSGISGFTSYNHVRGAKHGALLGRIGGSGGWFVVGSGKEMIANESGTLYLLINDADPRNNSGSFSYSIDVYSDK